MPRPRILVVDDEPFLSEVLYEFLRKDYDVVSVRNGKDALKQLNSSQALDLIICDVSLPDITGMDIYNYLQKETPGFEKKIIFISGEPVNDVQNPTLLKPFKIADLIHVVSQSLGQV